jgi:hypothetical protein
MSVTLKFTYQPSKSLPEANKQINEFVELVKSQLLGVATKEELDGVQVEVEENIKESTKGFAGVRTKATDAESKVDMIANFNQATAQITLKAAMVNGIERSDITLSGDQILLNGDTTIGSGFKLSAENLQITDLAETGATIGGLSITTSGITGRDGSGHVVSIKPGMLLFTLEPSGGVINVTPTFKSSGAELFITRLASNALDLRPGDNYRGLHLRQEQLRLLDASGTSKVSIDFDSNNYGEVTAERGHFGKLQTLDTDKSSGDDAVLTSTGYIRRKASGSSKRFKNSISYELTDDMNPEKLYDVSIVRFKYNKDYLSDEKDSRYDTPLIGMIAEDMDAHYPQACDYDEQGRPKGWNEHYIIPAMLKLIQDQHKEIEELKDAAVKRNSKIEELETQVAEVSELVKGLLQKEE